jgi:enoyl-CoA hydratase/carnithine racemase
MSSSEHGSDAEFVELSVTTLEPGDSQGDAPVDVITLNRPEARNALTFRTYDELTRAITSSSARCIIITGVDPAFCSGDDVKQVMGSIGDAARRGEAAVTPRLTPAAAALIETEIPVIAAVNGAAVGWGMELALLADLRIASDRARFGELFVQRGLCCDVAGLARLAQLVGRERASELLYTGRVIDAAEALEIGLVSRLVPHDELIETALGLAASIAANPPLAVRALKRGMRLALDPDFDRLGTWVGSTLRDLFATDDHREGVAAFLERRPPRFTGR